jgi:2-hydroxy-3-keto-5-methylthiopentenyl-1-phosphate phosphatase
MEVVLDWDGTVTEVDTLHMVVERFGDLDVFHAAEREIGRSLTLREVIALEMKTVTAPFGEVVDWLLDKVRVRAGFAQLVERSDPLIVSAGFRELIEPVLGRERITARLHANTIDAHPGGWVASFPPAPICEVCGEACKRSAVAGLGPFVFVGDGVSDRCIALAATRVFARSGLAAWLDGQGVPFEPFEDFFDVAAGLQPPAGPGS